MMFLELNDGRKINVYHVFEIVIQNTDIIYKSPKGVYGDIIEHFETSEEAKIRYEALGNLLINEPGQIGG